MSKNYLLDPHTIFEKINQAIANSVYIFDLEEKAMVWINQRGQELAGLNTEEVRQLGLAYLHKIMHPDDMPLIEKVISELPALNEHKPLMIEYRVVDRHGQYHWMHDRITVFSRDNKGRVQAVLGVATEINALKAHEQNQKSVIEKLNLSLSAAKMGTWEWDIEKNILTWDQRMYEMHDVAPDSSPMEEVWKNADRQDMEITNQKVREAVEKRQGFLTSYRTRYRNGEIHHIRASGKFVNDDSNYMYGVAWDSTEEVLTEKEIAEAKARLISSTKMAALGEMSGGIAHEINNPLTVIQARSFQLAQMVDQQKLDPIKVKQAAESISRTADKIAKIIKSLRSFAREGTYDPFELVPVKQLIEETLEFCRTRFYNHGVEVDVEVLDPDLEVECRVIQIEQVLLNLLNNSFDAIQPLEERWIRVSVKDDEEHLEIHVVDSGKGITADLHDQIMMPFFTTKELGKGTGLGLSISDGIIRSHQGTLTLRPEMPNTTFVVRLPKLQETLES